jgi:hypothetical protein
MATLQQQIAETFLAKLAAFGDEDAEKIAKLRPARNSSRSMAPTCTDSSIQPAL